ncbi:nitrite reductase small subunit NirD [Corynebacterium sp.]|jgi:nitrite reductase (NADH) small subunit|uniref:nitrite reductase small subunit NirD n=1 Tax=Corynebacterium sp. TaxID=1720 RepID=UPI0025C30455|nr:nitrite reductase small subunit NirD [Corynebacterium sp.]
MTVTTAAHTFTVCRADQLEDNLGAGVLLPDGTQIALFRVPTGEPDRAGRMPDSTVFAVSNIDPYSGAAVISRGIVGEVDGEPTVASPLLKQRFSLTDGHSLEDADHRLAVYPVEATGDKILVHC